MCRSSSGHDSQRSFTIDTVRAVVLPLVGMPTFRTPVFLWKILTISPMSFRRNGSPPVGRRNMRLPFPMLALTLSISSSDSSCLR